MICLILGYPQDGHAKKDSNKVWFNAAVYFYCMHNTLILFHLESMPPPESKPPPSKVCPHSQSISNGQVCRRDPLFESNPERTEVHTIDEV